MSVHSLPGETAVYQNPAKLLQNLIRFDTTNPPGNEADCMSYANQLLVGAGFQTAILGAIRTGRT